MGAFRKVWVDMRASLSASSVIVALGLFVGCGDSGSSTSSGGSDTGGSDTGGSPTTGGTGGAGASGGSGGSGGATTCGNGVIDGAEECDGAELGAQTCVTLEFDEGTLACSPTCTFDITACVAYGCGDGIINEEESCDGTQLANVTCPDFGFDGGQLLCAPGTCTYDTSSCANEDCTNAIDDEGDGLVDCGDMNCATYCADACSETPVLADPSVDVAGDTTGHADLYNHGCSLEASPELVYTFVPAVTGILDVSITSTVDLGVSVQTACVGGELGCSNALSGGTDTEELSVLVEMGVPVWIVVEGTSATDVGAFTISAASRPVICGDNLVEGAEACDDGNVVDGDGCDSACLFECAVIPCNDSNACTMDACTPQTGCTITPFQPSDGDSCTTDTCNPATGGVFTTPSLPHNKCAIGPVSTPFPNQLGCGTGVLGVAALVCAEDPYCCTTDWDTTCVRETLCVQSTGAPATNTAGTCDATYASCVAQICAVDSYCCNVNWDSVCEGRLPNHPQCSVINTTCSSF